MPTPPFLGEQDPSPHCTLGPPGALDTPGLSPFPNIGACLSTLVL